MFASRSDISRLPWIAVGLVAACAVHPTESNGFTVRGERVRIAATPHGGVPMREFLQSAARILDWEFVFDPVHRPCFESAPEFRFATDLEIDLAELFDFVQLQMVIRGFGCVVRADTVPAFVQVVCMQPGGYVSSAPDFVLPDRVGEHLDRPEQPLVTWIQLRHVIATDAVKSLREPLRHLNPQRTLHFQSLNSHRTLVVHGTALQLYVVVGLLRALDARTVRERPHVPGSSAVARPPAGSVRTRS